MKKYNNISADSILIEKDSDSGAVNTLTICNTHDSNAAVIDIFYTSGTESFYKIKGTTIPVGVTLVIDNMRFDSDKYTLMIGIGSSQTVDVLIR